MTSLALAQPENACYTPESYSRFRRLATPSLKNANIDKLDSCSEVTIGLFATIGMTLAIWVFAMPMFDIMGMPWMRSWEGSGMTMDRFRTSMKEADLGTEALDVSLVAENLHFDELQDDKAARETFEKTVKQRMVTEAGNDCSLDDVSLTLSGLPSGNATRMDCRVRVPKDQKLEDLRSTLTDKLPQLGNHMEMDLAGNPKVMELAHGPVIVHNVSEVVKKVDGRSAFTVWDTNRDESVDFDEFANGTEHMDSGMNIEEVRHAFHGLDANKDNLLEFPEFDACLNEDEFYTCNTSSFSALQAATRTSTTATTTTTVTPEDLNIDTKGISSTTHEPVATHTSTTTNGRPTTTTSPVVKDAAVEMLITAIDWADLSQKQREGIALAYRRDLAYAAGILSSQVMDAGDRSGCVSMRKTSPSGHLLVHGCLPIPEGATEADIEAVVTSGTETQKIVKDFLAVDGDAEVGTHDVKVKVTAEITCLSDPHDKTTMDTAESFCQHEAEPTTTREGATTTTAESPPQPPSTTGGGHPSDLPTMAEFLQRMGAADSDTPRDAFNALDTNSNEFVDWEEFEDHTKRFKPPLTLKEAENMYDWLDRNHDGRIESLEFHEAYKLSSTSAQPQPDGDGPITLAEYRQSLGHNVQYSKVGVGLCRTKSQAFPQSSEHPTAKSKADCKAICDGSSACGGFAFKVGGTCRIYPSGKEYPDTTPMTDVECFAKAISNTPLFDLVRVSLHLYGDAGEISQGQLSNAEVKLAESLAFEVGEPVNAMRSASGEPGKCTVIEADQSSHEATGPEEANTKELEAVCFIDVPAGEQIEDLTAVITTEATRKKVAQELSALSGMPQLTSKSIHAYVEGTSAKFRMTDTDHSGALSLAELVTAAAGFDPVIHEEAAEYAFHGLDWNHDNQLSPDEFEARGIADFYKTPVETQ